jgi:hypothetical protein
MVERPRTEPIDLDVEELSYVPGRRVDAVGHVRRWWDASLAAGPDRAPSMPTLSIGWAPTKWFTGSSSFWRVVDVPGDRLPPVLGAWWRRCDDDDGHLRLGEPHDVDGVWLLAGSLRTSPVSRRLAIEIRLSPYGRYWSVLELNPRLPVRPTRRYFRVGHDSLDSFIAALRALT